MAIFVPILKQSGRLESLHITVCNVGSRKLGAYDDYASQGWGVFAPNLTIYGFDADPEACEEANANIELRQENGEVNWTEIHIPIGLGSYTGEAKLYVTKNPMCSSLYAPNEPYLARFSGLPELVNLDFEVDIEITTLDSFCQTEAINEIDFLQIDVQGADLDVLKGASRILDSVLAIQIEVEFSHLYKDQPLFADIDTYLRTNGFSLFDLTNSRRNRTNSPIQSIVHPGQLLWGDAFYLRDAIGQNLQTTSKNPEQIFKLACIADVMHFSDYALELLKYLTLNHGATDPNYNFADIVIEGLTQFPELVKQGISTLPIFLEFKDYITKYEISTLEPKEVPPVNIQPVNPVPTFHSDHYMRHNQRRQEHLASLGLDIKNKSVLEVGAGIGDHTSFFVDRGCNVTSTEARPDCVGILRSRFPNLEVGQLDMESPEFDRDRKFEIVYCYGLLYHLSNPHVAIEFMANHCTDMLLLETCVSYGAEEAINPCTEPSESPSQAVSGQGCRPTRSWIFNELKKYFDFVYMPITQPNHEEFPLDWEHFDPTKSYTRSVFVASRQKLSNPLLLLDEMPLQQKRH